MKHSISDFNGKPLATKPKRITMVERLYGYLVERGPLTDSDLADLYNTDPANVGRPAISANSVHSSLHQKSFAHGGVEYRRPLWHVITADQVRERVLKASASIPSRIAATRTYAPRGEWCPPVAPRRPGSDDYQRVPSRHGEHRIPYR